MMPLTANGTDDFFIVSVTFDIADVIAGNDEEMPADPASRVTLWTMLSASVREAGAPSASLNAVVVA